MAAQERLSLGTLIDEALRNNREILAAQKRLEAARLRPSQASTLPEPVFSLGYTSNGSPRPFAGIGMEPTVMSMKVEELPPYIWESLGLPSKYIRSPEEREEMQVNAAKVQAAQMAPQGTAA